MISQPRFRAPHPIWNRRSADVQNGTENQCECSDSEEMKAFRPHTPARVQLVDQMRIPSQRVTAASRAENGDHVLAFVLREDRGHLMLRGPERIAGSTLFTFLDLFFRFTDGSW
jgi:hypothetical protein